MQFTDSSQHKRDDAEAIFKRAAQRGTDWVSGTEAAQGVSSDLRRYLAASAKKYGYRLHLGGTVWVAVANSFFTSYQGGFIPVIAANEGPSRHNPRGIAWVRVGSKVGTVNIAAAHYLTKGSQPGQPNYLLNGRLTRAIGDWGRRVGKGRALAFISADTNTADRTNDVFRGQPFTTLADELKQWKDTGHGAIDVIASYNADTRVKAKYWRPLPDSEFRLNTDHFACEGGFTVRP